tara:strand:- start:16890 stop:17978 length:1089 start_codon:yes stop_codon:yes gene_type:complete
MAHNALFQPLKIGAITAPNRIFMAPLTRNRSNSDGVPKPLAIEYYRQRAGAGLIISEGTQISIFGKGYLDTPGIYTDAQVEGWKPITKAVHDAGGRIACQLWHVGRISHVSFLPGGAAPVGPSAIQAKTKTFTAEGFADPSMPRAMTLEDIKATVADYAHAAKQAMAAGFDMVEIHSANGYLIDQFLRDGPNQRTDEYGGSLENRTRLLAEVCEAVTGAIGADRVGIRLSPAGEYQDSIDSDPLATFTAAVKIIKSYGLAFLHVIEMMPRSPMAENADEVNAAVKAGWDGVYIVNGGYLPAAADTAVATGHADAVAFGTTYIANPDLVERIRADAPLNPPNPKTFYGGGAEGYTDYPAMETA